jgi:hypothetical protein
VPRRRKLFAAILLLPLCVGVGRSLARLIAQFGMVDTTVVPLAAGAGCMFLLYHYAPKPMWIYVFGHEFTHAAATMACGGRVKGMKVTSEGGHVLVTKDNFFVSLAPYFVPLYVVLVLAIFAGGRALWGWNGPWAWGLFYWVLGLAYAFHVLLTWHILHTRQSDLTSQGYLFSAVIIFLGNALVLLLGLPHLFDGPDTLDALKIAGAGTVDALRDFAALAARAWDAGNSALN